MRGGRDDEVESFIAAHSTELLRTAVILTGNSADAQDLVQRSLLRVWGSWGRVRRADNPLAYARRIVANEHLTERRRRHHHVETPVAQPPATGSVDLSSEFEERDRLREVLAGLPPRQRAAVALRYVAGLDDAAIADALGCSVATVRSQISRALTHLRRTAIEVPDGQ